MPGLLAVPLHPLRGAAPALFAAVCAALAWPPGVARA
jgi:hypothetical protein